ncbi:hypothetical protein M0812_18606 [Anaeramoeba flamelloides]|uniref:DRBM domain-containing protein n=1 Tax=Anaeramoeba flamelloides TaxID=1746091 RepID=A0AAV7Z8R4_9EUKA|nr:hypothetical protein M0812_18606 [Anaeramoeba flamelloides]
MSKINNAPRKRTLTVIEKEEEMEIEIEPNEGIQKEKEEENQRKKDKDPFLQPFPLQVVVYYDEQILLKRVVPLTNQSLTFSNLRKGVLMEWKNKPRNVNEINKVVNSGFFEYLPENRIILCCDPYDVIIICKIQKYRKESPPKFLLNFSENSSSFKKINIQYYTNNEMIKTTPQQKIENHEILINTTPKLQKNICDLVENFYSSNKVSKNKNYIKNRQNEKIFSLYFSKKKFTQPIHVRTEEESNYQVLKNDARAVLNEFAIGKKIEFPKFTFSQDYNRSGQLYFVANTSFNLHNKLISGSGGGFSKKVASREAAFECLKKIIDLGELRLQDIKRKKLYFQNKSSILKKRYKFPIYNQNNKNHKHKQKNNTNNTNQNKNSNGGKSNGIIINDNNGVNGPSPILKLFNFNKKISNNTPFQLKEKDLSLETPLLRYEKILWKNLKTPFQIIKEIAQKKNWGRLDIKYYDKNGFFVCKLGIKSTTQFSFSDKFRKKVDSKHDASLKLLNRLGIIFFH